jgi:hypothetical protein
MSGWKLAPAEHYLVGNDMDIHVPAYIRYVADSHLREYLRRLKMKPACKH